MNRGTLSIQPINMAVVASGRTILLATDLNYPAHRENQKYGFAILDENDNLVKTADLPLPPGGGAWTFDGSRMAVGDGVAYVMVHSKEPPQTAIATISEGGDIDTRIVAVPPDSDRHHHAEWLFGPGVAVEVYSYLLEVSQRSRAFFGFNEYDLKTGEKVATKGSFPAGFAFGCYSGNEVSMLSNSAHVAGAPGVSPDALRLVTIRLEQMMPRASP